MSSCSTPSQSCASCSRLASSMPRSRDSTRIQALRILHKNKIGRLSSTQLEVMASVSQSTEVLAKILAERIRLVEWGHDQQEGQLQLAEQTLTRERNEHHRVLIQSHERVLDLEERLQVCSTQQATSFAESKARFEQQLITFAASSAHFEQQQTSNRVNDERIRQCLRYQQKRRLFYSFYCTAVILLTFVDFC